MHIVVLKDCPESRHLLCAQLREYGHEVTVAETVEQLAQIGLSRIDAILIDIESTASNGLELFDRVKSIAKKLPIVVFSLHTEKSDSLEFIREGAQDYLMKDSIGWKSLDSSLTHAVERNRLKLAEQNIESHTRFLLEQSYDAFIILDSEWLITRWNRLAEDRFGWKQEEVLGKSLSLIIPHHLQDQFLKKLKLRYQNKDENLFKACTEILLEGRAGNTFSAEIGVLPMMNETGGFCVYIRDISKQKQSRAELERLVHERTEKLSQSNNELRQFAKIASHDLQEPLRAVQGFANLLHEQTEGKLDKDCQEFIAYILDGTQRMSQLINAILTHAQVRRTENILLPTDCNSVMTDVLNDLRSTIDETQTTLEYETLPSVAVERSQVVQLFQNLISNSIKYRSAKSPTISISAKRLVNQWLFSFHDNGIGIDPQYAARVFDMFSRLHSKGKYPGTGIGLAICKKIVTSHGGNIWVESSLGQGCIFMFTLPVIKEKRKDKMKKKIEILLVEDTPSDVRLTQEALRHSEIPCELSIVTDGVEALEFLNKAKLSDDQKLPAIILLDLNLPRKNGHEVLEEIKADPVLNPIPVVLLTVSEREEDVLEALRSKMNYYVAKPVTAEKLCNLIKTLNDLHNDEVQDVRDSTREESHIRLVLAGNPHTPVIALKRLAVDINKRIRSKVAENSNINEELQLQLAKDVEATVRISLCENDNLAESVLRVLSGDEDHDVRLAVTTATVAAPALLMILAEDENVFVSDSAKKALALHEQGVSKPVAL